MNPKLIFSALGVALVPAIAVPTSISLTPNSQEDLIEKREEKETKETKETPLVKHQPARGFRRKPDATSQGYYISKYQDYFLDRDQNQDLWEQKFNKHATTPSRKIEVLGDDDDYDDEEYVLSVAATITSPWDSVHNFDHYASDLNFPLNVFCGEWYKSEGWEHSNTWIFYPGSNTTFSGIDSSHLWKLCSAFDFKPKTISEEQSQLKSLYSNSKLIGNKLKTSVVATNKDNDVFWRFRQEEWKTLDPKDSTYFAYQEDKSIKSLCEAAYKKEQSQEASPTLDEVKKYCSLEWDF